MSNHSYNSVDSKTSTITFDGASVLTKGNHDHMPSRTSAYLSTDERGHIQASSLGGNNSRANVVPMAKDLNHGSYYRMEGAERNALRDGHTIASDQKIAFSSNQPGNRPDGFMVNSDITFSNGETQTVHLSFANMQNDQQAALNNEVAAQASDMMDQFANPGDSLRDSMTTEEYATLMEQTDADLPSVGQYYDQWDYQGAPSTAETPEATASWDGISASESMECTAEDTFSADFEGVEADSFDGAEADTSDGMGADASDGAQADAGGSDGVSADDD